jgi:hypothetical protein
VGKKPPQSQKGGSHGLIPRNSMGLSPKKEKKFIYLFILFVVCLLVAGDLAELRRAAYAQEENQKKI